MPTIDADCHVIETSATWDYMEGADARYRALAPVRERAEARSIDPLRQNKETLSGAVQVTTATRTMQDIDERLRQMDRLGVDVQVLYPTLFLAQLTDDPVFEGALCRSYNRWLTDIWDRSQERLRWVAVLPLLDMDETLAQLRMAHGHGACGVFMR